MSTLPLSFTLPFVKREQLNADTDSFYFDRSKGMFLEENTEFSLWNFMPGQYIRMVLPHRNADSRGTSRFFTIASSPLNTKYLIITTKILMSSFKHTLYNLQPGSSAQFWGPVGKLVFDDTKKNPIVFLAGGIGVTPYYAMISYAYEKKISLPLTLFVSFSTPEEMIYYQELKNMSCANTAIKVVYTVTQPEKIRQPWKGETGRIGEAMIKKYVPNIFECVYFISGPSEMVETMVFLLRSMDIPEEQIVIEKFSGY